jgi:hypothetical protein
MNRYLTEDRPVPDNIKMALHGSPWNVMEIFMTPDSLVPRIRQRLSSVVAKQQAALADVARLLSDSRASAAAIEIAQERVNKFSAEHRRLMDELKLAQLEEPERYGVYRPKAGQRPIREQVLDILDELGVPSSPRTVSEFAVASIGLEIPVNRFSSLRRDEERAYRKDHLARPAWVVPALNSIGFTAIPRIVASSVWPPERRLIGPRSLRVNHLQTLLALVNRIEMLKDDNEMPAPLLAMIARYARNVPGALVWEQQPDLSRIRSSTERELAAIEPEDRSERSEAATKLKGYSEERQLWGLPAVLQGRLAGKRRVGR